MSQNLGTRISRLEDQLFLSGNRQELERQKRRHYNLLRVSDAALIANIASKVEGGELPSWAQVEFEVPLPQDADRRSEVEAESWAHRMIRGEPKSVTNKDVERSLSAVLKRARENGCESLMEFTEFLRQHKSHSALL